MKSIVQEASTLAKAIEQGWEKAGRPAEFTIRVLEEPVKNFLGFTTRSAKVALLFQPETDQRSARGTQKPALRQSVSSHEQTRQHARKADRSTPVTSSKRHSEKSETRQADNRTRSEYGHSIVPRNPENRENARRHEEELVGSWTPEMVDYARQWLSKTLMYAEKSDIGFDIEPQKLHLRITFHEKVVDASDREKQLFASIALLLMQAIKTHFNTGLRGHKIVLTHAGYQQYVSEDE